MSKSSTAYVLQERNLKIFSVISSLQIVYFFIMYQKIILPREREEKINEIILSSEKQATLILDHFIKHIKDTKKLQKVNGFNTVCENSRELQNKINQKKE